MSWYSKKDVLEDLAQAMGGRLKDIDEQHLVIGGQPPPSRLMTEEDDELFLRLNQGLVHDDKKQDPDLAGITKMLRMVDNFDNSESNEKNICSLQDNNTVISITKLNPTVKDFIPKNSVKDGSPEKKDKIGDKNDLKEVGISCKGKEKVHSDNIQKITEKLRKKIISPTQDNACVKMKTERNIAIASLLKLHSDPLETNGVNEKQPKLLTPQHFEQPFINDLKVNGSLGTSSSTSPNELMDNKQDENMNQELDSHAKVTSWLKMGEKPKKLTKALYLGPVTFKKKENIKPITPTSEVSEQTSSKSPSYVPTEYAEKLAETYKMRSKAKEDQSLDMWSKLERDLKAKDEVIKRQIQQTGIANTNARRKHQRTATSQ